LFEHIEGRESASRAVGVLESAALPPGEICQQLARDCRVDPTALTLLVAPTSSIAGTVQVVARTVETCLHKMHEIGFDITRVVSGLGVAPLPPVAADDLLGIGRTNDAVLYGGDVTLWMRSEDDAIEQIGRQIPSSSSRDYGRPFADIFQQHKRNFYDIDPLLFSPARVTLLNLETGRSWQFGELRPDLIRQSFLG
jgi:methenyltetrahydromethanopterin cyclohydrolase